MALDTKGIKWLYDERNNPIPLDSHTESTLGHIPGRNPNRKFGFNKDCDAAAEETLRSSGGRLSMLLSAETLSFTSDSSEDAAGGTGALTVSVRGVDNDFNDITEIVTMDGLNAAVTQQSFRMVNRMRVATAGSNRANVGTINVVASVALTDQGEIPAGYGTSQQMFFCIPAGVNAIMHSFTLTAAKLAGGQQPVITARLYQHQDSTGDEPDTSAIIYEQTFDVANTNDVGDEGIRHVLMKPGTAYEFTIITDTNDTIVYGHAEIDMYAIIN